MQTNFEALFEQVQHSPWTPTWLSSLRKEAFQHFQRMGLPERTHEEWRYTSLRPVTQGNYRILLPTRVASDKPVEPLLLTTAYQIVFINGIFAPQHSKLPASGRITMLPLEQALLEKRDFVENLLQQRPKQPRTSLEELNQALFTSGALIRVPPNVQLEQPIHLLYLHTDGGEAQLIAPRNLIVLEEGSQATILESSFSYLESHFTNMLTEVYVRAGAKLHYVAEKVLSSLSLHINQTRFQIERDAQVKSFNLSLGGRLARSQTQFELIDPGAEAQLDGLYIGRMRSHIDNLTSVQHRAAHTRSSQVYKGLLFDQSRAVFDGKISIAKHAQQTQAHQLNKTLLMSSEAEMDTEPQLRIDADDVRCSHGATIGRLNSNELFYLQSRGIPRDESETILSRAFLRDVIHRLGHDELEARLSQVLALYAGMEA